MRGIGFFCGCVGVLIFFVGCSHTAAPSKNSAILEENGEALKSVVGQLSGQPVDDKKLRDLSRQIEKDPEAKSAVEAVQKGMAGQSTAVKYCPVDGKRFSSKLTECPEHQVPLKEVTP